MKTKLVRKYSFKSGEYPEDSWDQSVGYFVLVSGRVVGFVYTLWPINYKGESTVRNSRWAVFDANIGNPKGFKTRKAAAEWVVKHRTHGVKNSKITW